MREKDYLKFKLNKIFSRNTIRNVLELGPSYLETINVKIKPGNLTIKEYINDLYLYLEKNYRNEYFYKNTILNKKLLGTYSVNTTVALSEVVVNKSKADLILINGKAVVYEIKTEYDNFSRLLNQLNDYYKAFKEVYVVTSEEQEGSLQNLLRESNAGIIVLTKRKTLSIRKKATLQDDLLDYTSMFRMLRKREFESLLKNYYGKLPSVKPVFYYEACFEWFQKIDKLEVYELMINQLKKRNIKAKSLFKKTPNALRSLTYFEDLSESEYALLNNVLNMRVRM